MARPIGAKEQVRGEIYDLLDKAQNAWIMNRTVQLLNTQKRSEAPSAVENLKFTRIAETQFEKTLYARLIGSVRVALEDDKLMYGQLVKMKEKLSK